MDALGLSSTPPKTKVSPRVCVSIYIFRIWLTSSGELEKGSPCSLHFLRCIKYNLQFIAHDWMLKTDVSEDKSKDDKALEEFADCFQKTTVEYHRLNKHPELFESKEVRTAFHHDALMIIKYLKHKKMPKELIEKLRIEVSLAASLEFERSFLPSADENRKPWQQFLHNNAPGSGIDLSSLAGEGTVQVIPHAAIRLLRGYRKDMKDMAEKLKKVSSLSNTNKGFCQLI